MRLSHLFGTTLRQPPSDAEMVSHQLLVRGGYVRQLSAGVYSFLPLGWRVIRKIEAIIRDEMNKADGQEMHMPSLNPAELWKETKRWYEIGPELVRFQDRMGRDMVLAMTHEEVVTDLARREIKSYRQLPVVVYHIQSKVRDEPRPRAGLIRLREFIMKDAYSFDTDTASLDVYYPRMFQAYVNVFKRSGVVVEAVEADPGMMGGTGSHEFMMLAPGGEDSLIKCQTCGYAANVEAAEAKKEVAGESAPQPDQAVPPPSEVLTPNAKTIDDLVRFFNLPSHCFLKTVAYNANNQLVVAVIRGDLDINEAKLARVLKTADITLAGDEMLAAAGIPAGFMSPVGLKGARVVVDDSVLEGRAYVTGANQPDKHLINVVFPRDFRADDIADIALAQTGNYCVHCGGLLETSRGIELGHTFKLGTKYSSALGATYLTPEGHEKLLVMGCYGIGLDRLMAAVVEQNHDEAGITWPVSVAPFQVYIAALGMDDERIATAANRLYDELQGAGYEVLFDDRTESPGVKFKDADLIGIPVRLTISARTLQSNSVELKPRRAKDFELVPLDEVGKRLGQMLSDLAQDTKI